MVTVLPLTATPAPSTAIGSPRAILTADDSAASAGPGETVGTVAWGVAGTEIGAATTWGAAVVLGVATQIGAQAVEAMVATVAAIRMADLSEGIGALFPGWAATEVDPGGSPDWTVSQGRGSHPSLKAV